MGAISPSSPLLSYVISRLKGKGQTSHRISSLLWIFSRLRPSHQKKGRRKRERKGWGNRPANGIRNNDPKERRGNGDVIPFMFYFFLLSMFLYRFHLY